ncbi:short-chain dehydrogenase [Subtercola boreus]|uniref:Short-chain dehydrogenase n=1 Tax=Subtercola boreus TaxID=120213 RepID=A0A3E0VU30_9MICO|nr:SDR family oxidoreductase [Subtercola boreus]RFA13105.1 short-chain dehydrogenase [Subtercola boreus]
MAWNFEGKTVLVTGGTGGIGRAVSEAFGTAGAHVLITGRNAGYGEDLVGRLRMDGLSASFIRADLSGGGAAVRDLASKALEAAGGTVDILVNNAAALVAGQSMLDATEEQIDDALAINVKVPFLLTAALVPAMIGKGEGVVVNMGSMNGSVGMSIAALYGATKAGLHSLTKSWAAELASQGVRVNTVAPGPTLTELNEAAWPMQRAFTAAFPDGRPGTAAEVASAVLFLASADAAHIHGVTLPVDGGATTR